MNPEFRRNLLLEMPPYRLIAMPLIQLLLYAAVGLAGSRDAVSVTATMVITGLLVFWGSRLAADSVLGEVAGRTWDSQRMSALGPWSMSWGKLFGSTAFVWYGTALSIPAFFYGYDTDVIYLLRLVLTGFAAQALALLTSLVIQRLRPARLRFLVTQAQLTGLAGAFLLWGLTDMKHWRVGWYGWYFDFEQFVLVSALVFLGWCCLGIYRLMRAELQFRCWPAGWSAFTLFCGIYTAGLLPESQITPDLPIDGLDDGAILRILWAHLVVLGLTWAAAFAEPKGFVRLRRWADAIRSGSARLILPATPAWAPGLLMAVVTTVLVLVFGMLPEEGGPPQFLQHVIPDRRWSIANFAVAAFLFMLRDIGIVNFLAMDGRSRRALLSMLVYFGVLYALLPVILAALGLKAALPVLVPSPAGSPYLVILPVLLQVGLVAGLIARRWATLARTMEEGKP